MKIPEPKKLPSGTWYIRMRLNGENVNVSASTRRECVTQAQLIKSEYRAGKRTTAHGTLRSATDDYLKRHTELSESTIKAYKSHKKNHMQDVMDIPFSNVDWQRQINEMDGTPKTKKNVWYFFHAAMSEKGFEVKVDLPTVKKNPMPWLTPEQIPTFLEAIKGTSCELPALLGLHSLRRSEIFALTPDDCDLTNNIIHVRNARINGENETLVLKDTKTEKSARDIPIMIPRLAELLEDVCKTQAPYILTDRIHKPYNQINAICRKAGLPEVGMHGLRRTFASLGYHLGMSEMEIMSIGGWDDWQTVHQFYLYLSAQDRLKAANKMSAFYN